MTLRFALFASTNGTDIPAILEAAEKKVFSATPAFLLTNNPECGAREQVKKYGIPIIDFPRDTGESREEYDTMILDFLQKESIDFIVLVGWMRILSKKFVDVFSERILNVHPSLLPKYPGMTSIADVLKNGEKETGATVHIVNEGVDTGRILLQKSVPILQNDTELSLKKKIQKVEQEIYPQSIRLFLEQ